MMEGNFNQRYGIRTKKDRKMAVVAVLFLVAAALFFSYQIIGLNTNSTPSGGGDATSAENVGDQIISAKSSIEGITTELDSIAALL